MSLDLDPDRVEAMVAVIVQAAHHNYAQGPISRDRVYEALNAIAIATAITLHGVGDRDARREANAWFQKALTSNIADLMRNPPEAP